MENPTQTIGQRIKEKRLALGLGLREAARLIGCGASTLRELEIGDSKVPSGKVLYNMCQVYKVSEGWVLNGKDGGLVRLDDREARMLESFRSLSEQEKEMLMKLMKNVLPNNS